MKNRKKTRNWAVLLAAAIALETMPAAAIEIQAVSPDQRVQTADHPAIQAAGTLDLAVAQAQYQQALAEREAAFDALARAQQAAVEALLAAGAIQAAADGAAQQAEEAELRCTQALLNQESAQTAKNDLKAQLTEKEDELNQAGQAVAKAEKNLEDVQNGRYLEAAKARYDTAQAQYDLGSAGFFQYRMDYAKNDAEYEAAQLALAIINDKTGETQLSATVNLGPYTDPSKDYDAANLENMKDALDMIAQSNELRTSDESVAGIAPLKVSDVLMAQSQKNVNYADLTDAHPCTYGGGENLALANEDPFIGWFDIEKKEYEKYLEDPNYDYDVASKRYGHYLNITEEGYTVTGFAISHDPAITNDRTAYLQRFDGFGYGEAYSDYLDNFMSYYNSVVNELNEARAAYEEAQNGTGGSVDTSEYENALAQAKAKYEKVAGEKQALEAQLAAQNAAVEEAVAVAQAAREALETARQTAKEKQDAADEANADYEAKQAEEARAQSRADAANEAVDQAKAALDAVVNGDKTVLTPAMAAAIPDQTWTGSEIQPDVTVRNGDQILVQGIDYTVRYSSNINVGTASITITGTGSWTGTVTLNFQIVSRSTRSIEMHRLYNPNSGEHFYTAQIREKDHLVSLGWKYEEIGWYAPESSSHPVYRLYNENAGDHHYTMSSGEKDYLVRAGWKDEGIGWYSDMDQGVPLYRQYNPNAKAGSHNYTISKEENDYLVSVGWKAEDIGWYGMQK